MSQLRARRAIGSSLPPLISTRWQFWVLRALAPSPSASMLWYTHYSHYSCYSYYSHSSFSYSCCSQGAASDKLHPASNTFLDSLFDQASHTCTLLSAEPAAINLLSGDHATVRTSLLKFA